MWTKEENNKTMQNINFKNGEKVNIVFKAKDSKNIVASNKRLKSISKRVSSNMKLEWQDIWEKETLKLTKCVVKRLGYEVKS